MVYIDVIKDSNAIEGFLICKVYSDFFSTSQLESIFNHCGIPDVRAFPTSSGILTLEIFSTPSDHQLQLSVIDHSTGKSQTLNFPEEFFIPLPNPNHQHPLFKMATNLRVGDLCYIQGRTCSILQVTPFDVD